MNSDIVIKAEYLGKSYVIGHQAEKGRQRYVALRDVVAQNARSYWNKTKDLLQGRPIIEGDSSEVVWALRDVNFEIRQGEAVGIVGRNGAGKSTLLKILSRITEPAEGRVTLRGRVASLLEVGTGFHQELSGRDNIYLNGAILGMTRSEIKRKFDEIVAFAEVDRYLDTPVKRYSSGMYVRLAFAVAAHLEPEILVVDEVLAVGDAEFQKKCLGKMSEVAGEGRTVLFVSHNLAAIQSLCPRSLLLSGGHIIGDGTSAEIVRHYHAMSARPTKDSLDSDEAGKYDLRHRENRYRPGVLIVRGLEIFDEAGMPTDVIPMGGSFTIVIDVQDMAEFKGSEIGIIVKTNTDQIITTIATWMTCSSIVEPRQNQEKAVLSIRKLPLTPGSYWIDISVIQAGIGRIDFVERACQLTVMEADVYGTGRTLPSSNSLLYLDGDWKIVDNTFVPDRSEKAASFI